MYGHSISQNERKLSAIDTVVLRHHECTLHSLNVARIIGMIKFLNEMHLADMVRTVPMAPFTSPALVSPPLAKTGLELG